jgi:outer membrane protein with beta-barrel domain
MRKMIFFVLAAAALLLMVPTQNAQAQTETPKVEIGAQYTLLRFRDLVVDGDGVTDSGVGGRVTFNLSDNIGLEGELNFFPIKRSDSVTAFPLFVDSTRTQGLFGVKTGMRSEKFGIFGKIRPGFVRFGESGSLGVTSQSFTQFALDIGGVFEIYPSRSVALRFDIGDTIIRFGDNFTGGDAFYQNNLQVSTGVAFRF